MFKRTTTEASVTWKMLDSNINVLMELSKTPNDERPFVDYGSVGMCGRKKDE